MSSGPSARNEKPRSARSSCGELTPEVEEDARERPEPAASTTDSKRRERGPDQRDPVAERGQVAARAASRAAGSRSSPTTRSSG